jgi:4-hydroxy-3-methylbut-2-enyl diphosphate reductase
MVNKVILAAPRGFCAGVVRAIDIVKLALQVYPTPIYVRKEIVHNQHVVNNLREQGVVFVESLLEVPAGRTVIFSAHGVSPEVRADGRSRKLHVIDATCPLVTKVHLEAARYAQEDFTIILIGHTGHDEVIGTMGVAPERMLLVTCVEDVADLEVPDPEKLVYLTQTTLSLEDTRGILSALKSRFPSIQGPPSEDICYATQNRQMAVRELAGKADLILVVGSKNSSNSNRLVEEARKAGVASHLIEDVSAILPDWLSGVSNVGVTSGASAPEVLVDEVVDHFTSLGASVEELVTRTESVQFALPVELQSDLKERPASN